MATASRTQRWWGGPLDTEQLARTAALRVRDAARELAAARGLDLRIDAPEELIAASFAAIDHLRIDGRAPQTWGELSGFVAARDGWVRLHGNYPHHAAALTDALGVRDRAGLERDIGRRDAVEIEERVSAAGGIAVAVRTAQQWREHPQSTATAGEPWSIVEDRGERPAPGPVSGGRRPIGDGPVPVGGSGAAPAPVRRGAVEPAPVGPGDAALLPLPLEGVRVLDLTRVIAGPTCTQVLACLGADVLRIDPPHRPELLDQHLSTGMGKRSAVLDLRRRAEAEQLRALASGADVILDGYRPGALAALGVGTGDLARLAPRAVICSLSAWGEHGPWGQRAGFDSIVQAATGIAVRCGSVDRPGALPVQALDHATGHLLAAHILDALARGRAVTVRASLLGAARTLLTDIPPPDRAAPGEPPPDRAAPGEPPAHGAAPGAGRPGAGPRADAGASLGAPLVSVPSADGPLVVAPPPLLLDGRTLEQAVGPFGKARAAWRV
ncbi:CoA transferase [Brachybacterium sp. AOP43-C2-M15]|uniref:CoA transferase n=1 Tax=Brachybacterium sp. AOP43-C2-M15 TaxID=3457661 RepID=UPI004033A193